MRRSDLPVAVADPFHMGHVAFRLDRGRQRVQMFAVAQRDFLAEEIEPITISGRKGDTVVDADESVRPDTTLETLGRLKELDVEGGGTTAGNAPGVNDGAAALVLASEEWATANGATVLGFIRGHAYVAGRTQDLAKMPGAATKLLLEREGPGFGRDRATLLVRVLVVAHDLALARVLEQPDADPRAFADTFADVVRDVRTVFR